MVLRASELNVPTVTLKQYSHWLHQRCGITHITLFGFVFKMKKAGSGGVNSTPGSTNAGISLFDPTPGTREPSPHSLDTEQSLVSKPGLD